MSFGGRAGPGRAPLGEGAYSAPHGQTPDSLPALKLLAPCAQSSALLTPSAFGDRSSVPVLFSFFLIGTLTVNQNAIADCDLWVNCSAVTPLLIWSSPVAVCSTLAWPSTCLALINLAWPWAVLKVLGLVMVLIKITLCVSPFKNWPILQKKSGALWVHEGCRNVKINTLPGKSNMTDGHHYISLNSAQSLNRWQPIHFYKRLKTSVYF